jgi:hypothetical protein
MNKKSAPKDKKPLKTRIHKILCAEGYGDDPVQLKFFYLDLLGEQIVRVHGAEFQEDIDAVANVLFETCECIVEQRERVSQSIG